MRRPSILLSYAFLSTNRGLRREAERMADLGHAVMVDSGAFSAWRSGMTVSLDDYVAFVKENEGRISRYVQLDVIGDEDATLANLAAMRRAGLDPVPVLLMRSPTALAAELADGCRDRRMVCVAGGTGLGKDYPGDDWYRARVAAVRRVVGDDCWIHCLGYTRGVREVATMPADSFDSSTWGSSQRYGILQLLSDRDLISKQVPVGRMARRKAAQRRDLWPMLMRAGVGPEDMGEAASATEGAVVRATHDAFVRFHEIAAASGKEVHYAAMYARQVGLFREAWERRARDLGVEP